MGLTRIQTLIQGLNALGFRKHLVGGEQKIDCGHYKNGRWIVHISNETIPVRPVSEVHDDHPVHTLMHNARWDSEPNGVVATFATNIPSKRVVEAIRVLTDLS